MFNIKYITDKKKESNLGPFVSIEHWNLKLWKLPLNYIVKKQAVHMYRGMSSVLESSILDQKNTMKNNKVHGKCISKYEHQVMSG